MTPRTLRAWSWTHKWPGLVCAVFTLLTCLAGLYLWWARRRIAEPVLTREDDLAAEASA